ncbi:uncharacterized protein EAE98_008937 [Botrytis deweyae]|uniref:Uncharacterized protein n=1 Tax=Botrytis deweyae TaxID=2478750 RepID=A0ABQ7ICK7_9HELO|nr:uncharacterized protein EAE98_008937 [Botrytis deweyae]KAF7920244.1 hypothetical protein EAE98_008937 [Botrytis deweyae]
MAVREKDLVFKKFDPKFGVILNSASEHRFHQYRQQAASHEKIACIDYLDGNQLREGRSHQNSCCLKDWEIRANKFLHSFGPSENSQIISANHGDTLIKVVSRSISDFLIGTTSIAYAAVGIVVLYDQWGYQNIKDYQLPIRWYNVNLALSFTE